MGDDTSIDMKMTVDELIAAPFSTRSRKDRERIVSEGRPTPAFKLPSAAENTEAGSARRKMEVYDELKWRYRLKTLQTTQPRHEPGTSSARDPLQSMYDEVEWLTASATTRNFYCWPCLLFQPPDQWNKAGVSDAILLAGGAADHEKTTEHIEAMFHLQTFANQAGDSPADTGKDPRIWRRVTDVVCSLVAVQRPPCESDDAPGSLPVQKCLETMALLRKYDCLGKHHSDDALRLIQASPEVVRETLKAVARVIRSNVAKELASSKYVSLILSQHSNVKLKAQISSVLRYVKSGKIRERFLGFSHVFAGASVDSVHAHVRSVVKEFDIATKCVAVSIDGAILHGGAVTVLCRKLKNDVPRCILVPCHSHVTDHVLQKSLSTDPRCERFFKTMIALETFFRENASLCAAFEDFMPDIRLRDVAAGARSPGSWFVTPQFLNYVLENRQHFILFFDFLLAGTSKWAPDDIARALGFRECLQDFTTVLLLHVFAKIFRLTSDWTRALGGDMPERNFGKGLVSGLVKKLDKMREKDFPGLLREAAGRTPRHPQDREYVSLFEDIVRQVAEEIETRYGQLDSFRFCSLFDFEDLGWFDHTADRVRNLAEFYDVDFGQPQILSELQLLWKHRAFSKKSAYDFHQYLLESNLKHTFKALFDISELVLALPFKDLSPTGEVSVLNNIGKWSFGPNRLPACDDTSIVFVESDYLQEMKQSQSFYGEVLAHL